MSQYRIVPAGDSVVIVEFEEKIDPGVNARTIACANAIEAARIDGVRDVVPTHRSVAVYFDPLHTDSDALMERIAHEAEQPAPPTAAATAAIRIPVCYGGDCGPDLAKVAAFAGLSEAGVIDIHAAARYRVLMLGFTTTLFAAAVVSLMRAPHPPKLS